MVYLLFTFFQASLSISLTCESFSCYDDIRGNGIIKLLIIDDIYINTVIAIQIATSMIVALTQKTYFYIP